MTNSEYIQDNRSFDCDQEVLFNVHSTSSKGCKKAGDLVLLQIAPLLVVPSERRSRSKPTVVLPSW